MPRFVLEEERAGLSRTCVLDVCGVCVCVCVTVLVCSADCAPGGDFDQRHGADQKYALNDEAHRNATLAVFQMRAALRANDRGVAVDSRRAESLE